MIRADASGKGSTWHSSYGPDERALFERPPDRLYEEIARARRRARRRPGWPRATRAPCELLLELGLLRATTAPAATRGRPAVRPGAASSSPLGQQRRRADLGVRQLGPGLRRARPGLPPLTVDAGAARSPSCAATQIDRFLQDSRRRRADGAADRAAPDRPLGRRARRRPPTATSRALERGVSMRTLYQHSARRSAPPASTSRRVTAEGAEVRTLDEFFNRLIVVDRRGRDHPGRRRPRRRHRDPRPGRRGLPRRHLRALLGARPAVHQPRDRAR